MTTTAQQQEFPIAFAEQIDNNNQPSSQFYVEWLENSSEFPGLASSATINDLSLSGGNWELLQRKEAIDDDGQHVLIPVEEDDDDEWSKLNTTAEKEELYSEVIEKNAADLQPKTYTVQPLWTRDKITSAKDKEAADGQEEEIQEDDHDENYEDYEDNLGAELVDSVKSQSRRTNRLSNRRKIHDLKVVDTFAKGIHKMATSRGVQPACKADGMVTTHKNMGRSDKANALVMCSKYAHNMKTHAHKYIPHKKQDLKAEIEEYVAQCDV